MEPQLHVAADPKDRGRADQRHAYVLDSLSPLHALHELSVI